VTLPGVYLFFSVVLAFEVNSTVRPQQQPNTSSTNTAESSTRKQEILVLFYFFFLTNMNNSIVLPGLRPGGSDLDRLLLLPTEPALFDLFSDQRHGRLLPLRAVRLRRVCR
jgi:hypothetical protein